MDKNQNDHYLSPEKEIEKLYNGNVRKFVGKYRGEFGVENCLDAFQEAVHAVHCSIKDGRRTKEKGEIENANALLFKIGRNKLIDVARKNKQEGIHINTLKEERLPDEPIIDRDLFYSSERIERIRAGIRKLGKKCREIITLSYDEGYDYEEIAQIMNYTGYDVVKTRLSVCIKDLKKLVFSSEQTNI